MKLVLLLTAVHILCLPVAGSPLRAPDKSIPDTSIFSINPFSTRPGSLPGAIGLDEMALRATPDPYATPHTGFAPLPYLTALPGELELSVSDGLDSAPSFGPQSDPPIGISIISPPIRTLLSLSSLLGSTEPPDLLFLITGLIGVAMAFFPRLQPVLKRGMTNSFRKADHPGHKRVRIQQRKMAC